YVVPTWRVVVPTDRYVVPTGRVVVPTGRYVVPTGRVVVPTGRYVVPTGRVVVPTGRYVVLAGSIIIVSSVGLFAAVLTYLAVLVDAATLGELCLAALTGTFPEFVITAVRTKFLLG
nr:hypothetical protein [Tanacetum cinerariifolium]